MEYYLKIADIKVVKSPDTLKTVVGSCIALCLWDKTTASGGMVHIMMPDSKEHENGSKGKYADTAVRALIDKMIKTGCKEEYLTAEIAGGASMFLSKNHDNTDGNNIGMKNSQTVKKILHKFNIPLKSEDTGGTSGRRIVFDPSTGEVLSNVIGKNQV